jgi:hypothetical protein
VGAIKQPCDRTFSAYHDSGIRDPKKIKWIVVHDTEGGSAHSVAVMFSHPESTASTHLAVDQLDCYRMLDDKDIPWGAPGANTYGYHIEHVGFAHWTREEWLAKDATLRRGAYKAALRCVWYKIPTRWVGKWGLKVGIKGLTTHKDCTDAFKNGYGHYDPGPNFPKDVYLSYVKEYVQEIKADAKTVV